MQNIGTTQLESRHFRLQQIAGGVWAAIALAGTGAGANAGIVDLGDRSLVFDTFRTPQAAFDLRRAAEQLTGRPVAYVVNSHRHGDHLFGNQAFADSDIIATAKTREMIAIKCPPLIEHARIHNAEHLHTQELQLSQEADDSRRQQLAFRLAADREFGAALPTFQLRLPTQTFEKRLVLYGTHRSAELISYGGGHTEDDAFLYLPGARIAFMGDLLAVKTHPALWDGNPEEWVRILQQVEMLDLAIIIPGHGPVGTAEDLGLLRQYITELTRITSAVVGGGHAADDAAAAAIPVPFDTWEARDLFARNMLFLHDHLVKG
ncbi:MAG TPA: MBL fold metallo-hydrolase [Chloroflexia bacterium]|nr:MBL fold metallo-hydrolase [Chloroflexia bacterium]